MEVGAQQQQLDAAFAPSQHAIERAFGRLVVGEVAGQPGAEHEEARRRGRAFLETGERFVDLRELALVVGRLGGKPGRRDQEERRQRQADQ